jgi:hypothetical protein
VTPYGDGGLVHIARDAAEFVAGIEASLAERDGDGRRSREADAVVAKTSWDRTWRSMATLLQAGLGARTRAHAHTHAHAHSSASAPMATVVA